MSLTTYLSKWMYFPLGIFSIASYVGTNHGIGWNKIESLLLRCWGEKVRLEFCQGSLRKSWNQLIQLLLRPERLCSCAIQRIQ